jgi:hypothetical protein
LGTIGLLILSKTTWFLYAFSLKRKKKDNLGGTRKLGYDTQDVETFLFLHKKNNKSLFLLSIFFTKESTLG